MECKRWCRYGKDRLYVRAYDGQPLGWWDLVTDEAHTELDGVYPALAAAVSAWRESQADGLGADGASRGRSALGAPPPAEPLDSAPRAHPSSVEAGAPGPMLAHQPRGPEFSAPPAPPSMAEPVREPEPSPPAALGWTEPEGADLMVNAPAQHLMGQVEAAHRAGHRPTLLRRILYGKYASSSWERGAVGEQLVARELRRLVTMDPSWHVIHSIPVGENGADIDHLVIGPGGIFVLNTKHHRGCSVWVAGDTYMVNGHRQPFVGHGRAQARRVSRLLWQAAGLNIAAMGVVVPVEARRFTVKRQPRDVAVVARWHVANWLHQQPVRLSPADVTTVFRHARLASTWRDPSRLDRLDRLTRERVEREQAFRRHDSANVADLSAVARARYAKLLKRLGD